jgi:DNA-binding GntR family transcriptional regulator
MTIAPEPPARANLIDRPSSLKDSAYRAIKDQLVSGQLEHDKIYSAQHFAALLGVSRTPVREAMLQLAGEGFLVCLEARGFKIKPFSEREIRDVFETRRMIETFVAKQVVEKLTAEDIRQLKENLRLMGEHAKQGSAHGFMEADKAFHLSLVRCAGNEMLVSIMETIRNHIALFGLKALAHEGRFDEVMQEHRNIIKALEIKDRRRALHAVHYHLAATERCLLGKDQPATG